MKFNPLRNSGRFCAVIALCVVLLLRTARPVMSFLGALVYSTIIVLNWYEEGRSVAINAWLVAMVSLMYLVYGWVVRPVFLTDEFTLLGMQLICFLWTCGASCVLAQGPDNVLYRNCNGVICTTIEDV